MEQQILLLQQLEDCINQDPELFSTLWDVRQDVCHMILEPIYERFAEPEAYISANPVLANSLSYLSNGQGNACNYVSAIHDLRVFLSETKLPADFYVELEPQELSWSRYLSAKLLHSHSTMLSDEYERFWNMIVTGQNFALVRNGDGERCLMLGKSVHAQEHWEAPSKLTSLGKALLHSIQFTDPNYYYGISCPCCDPKAYFWYLKNVGTPQNTTFASLWANHNYQRFSEDFPELHRDAVLIANYKAAGKKIGNLNILDHYAVSDDGVSFWENEAEELLQRIINDHGHQKNLLYVVSAGPMSGPIIERLYRNNPENCYIDFGSSLDPWLYGEMTRPYMLKDHFYSQRNCWMQNSDMRQAPLISVVLTLYKRPESLIRQLKAIEAQSIPPYEILLFQDGIDHELYQIELSNEIKDRISIIYKSPKNAGVWGRFRFADEKATGDYVCVLDDDTIPGERWLENCYMHMIQKEAVYGTVGIVMEKPRNYPSSGFFRIGFPNPLQQCTEVDFAGHSWFMKRCHLRCMMKNAAKIQESYKLVGEDAWLSYQCLSDLRIPTLIPPHYRSSLSFWGSTKRDFGTEQFAISMNPENIQNMNLAVNEYLTMGWSPLEYRDPSYVTALYQRVQELRQDPDCNPLGIKQ